MEINKKKAISLEEAKQMHGGYWRYNITDFHYLYNFHFPNKEMLQILKEELPELLDVYPSAQKIMAKLLSEWNAEHYFKEDYLVVGNGSSELIRILNQKLTDVIVPLPTFNEYTQIEAEKVTFFPADEKEDFLINEEELIDFVMSHKMRYIILTNPNNPTGQLYSKEMILRLLKKGIIVIIDEAFIDWCPQGSSCEHLIKEFDNLVIIKSLTKVAGCGGIRLGYMLTRNQEILDYVRKRLPIWNVNSIAERFLELMVNYKDSFWDSIERTEKSKANLISGLADINEIKPLNQYGNFVFCKSQFNAKKLEQDLFQEHGILIKAGINQISINSDSFFRIGVRTEADNQKIIDAIKEWLKK